MLRHWNLLAASLVVLGTPAACVNAQDSLADLVQLKRGICLLAGENSSERIIALAESTELTIVVQCVDRKDVRRLQKELDTAKLLGTRVYVSQIENGRCCLATNLADVVVSNSDAVPRAEMLRVLRPRGRLVSGGKVTIKPVPEGTGEWTHPYQDAANNPLAKDRLAKAPYLTKFLSAPYYGPMPEITLSSGGRIFKAFGHLAFKEREWPMLGKLIAMDGYNGTLLWERDMEPGFMIHRNTIVATPDTIYLADHLSCKLIDAATGEIRDEIKVPEGLADGNVWKWMTIKDGTLYALVGEEEQLHSTHKGTRGERGWPWTTVKETYGKQQKSWGFGRTLMAMDLKSRKVLWSKKEEHPIDSRATSMSGDRIFVFCHGKFLAAVDAKSGKDAWRTDSAAVLNAVGEHDPADNPRLGYSTSSYMKSTEDAIFFAGPQRKKLAAVSAKTGQLLWSYDDGNMQLIIRPDGLYAMGRMQTSKKFDPLTGEILADLQCFRGNCTRATGTVDSIFTRGYRHTGTMRFDVTDKQPHRLPSMRPACQDGVIASNGQLYWGPWMCDCNHSLVGVISLQSAGDFDFDSKASNENNLRTDRSGPVKPMALTAGDWPTYRADNRRTSVTPVEVPSKVKVSWHHQAKKDISTTPAIAVGDAVFFAGSDGIVRSLNANSGEIKWSFATDGRVFYPPSFSDGRLFAGSADGWVYALEAATGESLWRFRAAPVERRMPVYGQLSSTWPVASGVLVDGEVAYAAAGIASHDGTYVYGLNAKTGKIVWQNTESGSLTGDNEASGVSVQGHLLMNNGNLYMAGGNVVSPAVYDAKSGLCLNELNAEPPPANTPPSLDTPWQMQRSSRGSELSLKGEGVVSGGRMLYSQKQDGIASRYNGNYTLQASSGDVVIRGDGQFIERIDPKASDPKKAVLWKRNWFASSDAIVIAKNAVVVAGQMEDVTQKRKIVPAILALNLEDGSVMWSHRLPHRVVSWGLAVTRAGSLVISMSNGDVACLAAGTE
jgi:outer membrane protein assembly factor BamB